MSCVPLGRNQGQCLLGSPDWDPSAALQVPWCGQAVDTRRRRQRSTTLGRVRVRNIHGVDRRFGITATRFANAANVSGRHSRILVRRRDNGREVRCDPACRPFDTVRIDEIRPHHVRVRIDVVARQRVDQRKRDGVAGMPRCRDVPSRWHISK